MVNWTAIWVPGPMRWELTITSEKGDIAMQMPSHALSIYPKPMDGVLEAMGMEPGDWEQGEGGTFTAPLTVTEAAEGKLVSGLLARGRTDPRGKARDGGH